MTEPGRGWEVSEYEQLAAVMAPATTEATVESLLDAIEVAAA